MKAKRTLFLAGCIGFTLLAVAPSNASADCTAFNRIFVFGDSLSDTGNFYTLTGGYPPAPYYNGRFSNGKLWIEYTADALHLAIQTGDNYAVAGATTGYLNVNNGLGGLTFPGLQDQLDAFQRNHSTREATDALFVVWAGANDFFAALAAGASPQLLVSNGVYNTALAIARLEQSGARNILVLNVPDLGVTPYALGSGVGPQLTQLCAAYNATLAETLERAAAPGISIILVDAFKTLDDMVENPAAFDFTNVIQACVATNGNPDDFLFWDPVHPTTLGHAVLAEQALDSLVSYYSSRQGKAIPDASSNGLRGLVQARSH